MAEIKCRRCGHTWWPRKKDPKRCANRHCNTYFWRRLPVNINYRTPKK